MNFLASLFVRSQKAGKKAALSRLKVIRRKPLCTPLPDLLVAGPLLERGARNEGAGWGLASRNLSTVKISDRHRLLTVKKRCDMLAFIWTGVKAG